MNIHRDFPAPLKQQYSFLDSQLKMDRLGLLPALTELNNVPLGLYLMLIFIRIV